MHFRDAVGVGSVVGAVVAGAARGFAAVAQLPRLRICHMFAGLCNDGSGDLQSKSATIPKEPATKTQPATKALPATKAQPAAKAQPHCWSHAGFARKSEMLE